MKFNYTFLIAIATVVLAGGCKKDETVFQDPYAGGKEALGIVLNVAKLPSPSSGDPGATITFEGKGILPYKDKISFFFNGEKAEIISVDETGIKAKVPANASSGVVSIGIDDQVFFGPRFVVTGFINRDPTFRAVSGANDIVNKYLSLPDGRGVLVGAFTNYDNKGVVRPINRIVRISPDGEIDRSFASGAGANFELSSILSLNNRYLIAGGFSGYDLQVGRISNITQLNTNGTIDTTVVKTFTGKNRGVPIFNGGTDSYIGNIGVSQGKVVASGSFQYYFRRRYDQSTKDKRRDTVIIDSTRVGQIIRFNADGTLDKTFRFNTTTNQGLLGSNGFLGTHFLPDGKILVFGRFTRFDNATVNNILRLNADGTIDNTFNVGTGTNEAVSSVTYNATTKKYAVCGLFNQYNNTTVGNVILLNEDGSLDAGFVAKPIVGTFVTFAKQLSDGHVLLTGSFTRYNNVSRNNFAVLDTKGDLAVGYNAVGNIRGQLLDAVETRSADSKKALLLIGAIYEFDNLPAYNILRVTLE